MCTFLEFRVLFVPPSFALFEYSPVIRNLRLTLYYSHKETIVRVFKLGDDIYNIYIVIPFHDETVCLYIKICNYVLIRNLHIFVEAFYVNGT